MDATSIFIRFKFNKDICWNRIKELLFSMCFLVLYIVYIMLIPIAKLQKLSCKKEKLKNRSVTINVSLSRRLDIYVLSFNTFVKVLRCKPLPLGIKIFTSVWPSCAINICHTSLHFLFKCINISALFEPSFLFFWHSFREKLLYASTYLWS